MTRPSLRSFLRALAMSGVLVAATHPAARLESTPVLPVLSATSTAAPLPGMIEAEDFDDGPSSVAFADLSPGNEGGAYRDTDVDLEPCWDVLGGYNVGWAGAGEWLNYTVDLAVSGRFTIDVRVASAGPGGSFHIEVDGIAAVAPISVPDTGGWQTWMTLTMRDVPLAAGTHVLRLVMDTNGGSGAVANFNWIRVTLDPMGASAPYADLPRPLPGTIQAEDFDTGGEGAAYHDRSPGNAGGAYRETDVDLEGTADTPAGVNVGYVGAGEWLNYTVNVARSGSYIIEVRLASPAAGGIFHIEIDGVDRTGPLGVPATGGWQQWTTIARPGVQLPGGVSVLRLVMDREEPETRAVGNFDWIRVTAEDHGGPGPFTGVPYALPGIVEAENFDHGGEGLAYHDTSTGNSGASYRDTDVDVERTLGDGYNVGWVRLAYAVDVAVSGRYVLDVRVASPVPGGTFHLEMNGLDVTGPLSVPATGDWQQWSTVTLKDVQLTAGPQTLRLVMASAAEATEAVGNFDWIRVIAQDDPPGASLKITDPTPGARLRTTSVTFRWSDDGAGDQYWLDVGSVPGANDIYSSGWIGPVTELRVDRLPLNGQTLHVRLQRAGGTETVSAVYTAPVRKGLLVITDFADRVLEDWTGLGMRTVDDVGAELWRMSDHWAWLSRGREKIQWDIIRVQLPQNVSGAFSDWTAFRRAVAALALAEIDVLDYDVNSDGLVDAAWLIVSSGDDSAPYALGGASLDGGVNMFVDGQASGSVVGKATGNFNHELGHLLGLVDMYGDYTTMSSLTVMGYSWPVPPPDFSAYERIALGWMKPQVITQTTAGVWLPSALETFAAVKVPTSRPHEYFLIEYRQRPASGYGSGEVGRDRLPVHYDGLAVYHVFEGQSMSQNPPLMKLEPADGAIAPGEPTQADDFLSPENPYMILPMVLTSYYGDAPEVFRIQNVVRRDGGIAFDLEIAPPPSEAPVNLLSNPSFEAGDLLPAGWFPNAYLQMPDAFVWPSAEAVSGSRSAHLDVKLDNDARWVQTVTGLMPGESYQLCGWLKGSNIAGSGPFGANISIIGGFTAAGGYVGTFDWTQTCLIFTPTATSTEVACRLGFYGSTISGQVWCDDFSLVRLRKPF
jgi:hypothetical protein